MKSLQESLFDSDLVLQKLPYEKLLKGRISRDDILHFIAGCYEGDFVNVKNRVFHKWCSDFWDREVSKNGTWDTLCPGYYTWVSKNDISQEALDWIKPGKIHNDVTYNDAMYANSLDVSWKWWGEKQQWENITEWTIVTKYTNIGAGYYVYALANRKDYSETDQTVIHKMIETLSK